MDTEGHGITIGTARLLADIISAQHAATRSGPPQHRRRYPIGGGTTLTVGKVYDPTIPMRQSGNVEIWSGTAGSEVDSGSKSLFWNMCPQTLTKNCWVSIVGGYVVQVINPALFINATLNTSLAPGGVSQSPSVNGFFNGADPTPQTQGMSATITDGGSGYTSTPTITISGGGGTDATATCTIENGVVTSITITNPGSGYTSAPTIQITGGGGLAASASATVNGIYASALQTGIIASGTAVVAVWNDVLQQYQALDWGCS